MQDDQSSEFQEEQKDSNTAEESVRRAQKKKFPIWIVFVAVAVVLIGLLVTPVWDSLYTLVAGNETGIAQLRVESPDSTVFVYIDNELIGETQDGMLLISDVTAEVHAIRLEREASLQGFYEPLERELTFMEGTEVEIEWLAGPTAESSEGVLKYFRQRPAAETALRVFFIVYPDTAKVEMDGNNIDPDTLSIEIDDVFRHDIVVSKDGFEAKAFTIDAGLFGSVDNADLVVEVYLYQSPVELFTDSNES